MDQLLLVNKINSANGDFEAQWNHLTIQASTAIA
jgi:hypothetical protein